MTPTNEARYRPLRLSDQILAAVVKPTENSGGDPDQNRYTDRDSSKQTDNKPLDQCRLPIVAIPFHLRLLSGEPEHRARDGRDANQNGQRKSSRGCHAESAAAKQHKIHHECEKSDSWIQPEHLTEAPRRNVLGGRTGIWRRLLYGSAWIGPGRTMIHSAHTAKTVRLVHRSTAARARLHGFTPSAKTLVCFADHINFSACEYPPAQHPPVHP